MTDVARFVYTSQGSAVNFMIDNLIVVIFVTREIKLVFNFLFDLKNITFTNSRMSRRKS